MKQVQATPYLAELTRNTLECRLIHVGVFLESLHQDLNIPGEGLYE